MVGKGKFSHQYIINLIYRSYSIVRKWKLKSNNSLALRCLSYFGNNGNIYK